MKKLIMVSMIILVGLSSCNTAQSQEKEALIATVAALDSARTSVAKTMDALSTRLASTPVPPIPTLKETGALLPTQTLPDKTLVPSQTLPPSPSLVASYTKGPCDIVGNVYDVTIPDGTFQYPNSLFTKTWELKNAGSCTWNAQYSLVFAEGEQMKAAISVPLMEAARTVAPGQSVQVSIQMTAPASIGKKTGYWKLKNPVGATFGVGAAGSKPFWIEINVATNFTLIDNMCNALWSNATIVLPCAGKTTDAAGSVSLVNGPKFAGGYQENEPAILMVPQMVTDGYVVGKFPAMTVQKSDFVTLVACAFEAPKCSARVILTAQEGNNTEKTLLDVVKTADNGTTPVSVDMSVQGLIGKSVIFRLYVKSNGSPTDDRIYWVNPRLVAP